MKVSIITSTFNSAETLRDTISSVQQQDYPNLEYIIVDGASTDDTMNIVDSYGEVVTKSLSEPDKGIYDALNKGIGLATGDVIGFLHSDDFFPESDIVSRIMKPFLESDIDSIYGDLDYVSREQPDRVIRKWRSQEYDPALFYKGWMPAHPTFYLKRGHYNEFGGYRTDFKQSADYELMLRMLLKHELQAQYIPQVLVKMRVGGASNVSWKNRWRANQEDAKAWKVNGLEAGMFTRWAKPVSKLKQFLGGR